MPRPAGKASAQRNNLPPAERKRERRIRAKGPGTSIEVSNRGRRRWKRHGGRETEAFIRSLPLPGAIPLVLVNESGASVYSASKVAREEFPDHDVTVRGAVSIGRRLMDPLAELVKIDPKSIGVGQYQHDVDQPALKRSLDDGSQAASTPSAWRPTWPAPSFSPMFPVSDLSSPPTSLPGETRTARSLPGRHSKKVPRLGPKAFEQAAGFLRIQGGKNPLDASAVHPESYPVVEAMAADLGCAVEDLMREEALRRKIDLSRYVTEKAGLPTLNDILKELAKPGRDPRQDFEVFRFAEGIERIEDLREGMKLDGIVTNVTAFGAFVDIGVHQDGLVHVSQLSDRFVKEPHQVVKVQQKVRVIVLAVDLERKRISLSMKKEPDKKPEAEPKKEGKSPAVKPPARKEKREPAPFNNPFVQAFKRQK